MSERPATVKAAMTESVSRPDRSSSPSRRRRIGTVVLLLAGVLVLTACGERPLSTLDNESDIGDRLSRFLWIVLIIAGFVFVAVQGMVIYMSRRFRVKVDDDDMLYPDDEFPEQVHGNTRLEILWTLIPTVVMAVIGFFTLGLLFDLEDLDARGPDPQIEKVVVVGQQWWWEFQYHLDSDGVPDIVTAGELVLPKGEEVDLEVTSRDVIHSFWVPALNGKRDAVPGRTNTWTIQANEVGRYPGECTEFCGLSHAYMEKWAVGLEVNDWISWAENQMKPAEAPAEGSDAAKGWAVFSNNCASCHVVNGLTSLGVGEGEVNEFSNYDGPNRFISRDVLVSGNAPNLTHIATRSTFAGGIYELYENPDDTPYIDLATEATVNRGDLEAWIINAPEMKANAWEQQRGMTPFESLSAEDVDHLVEFLLTLD